MIYLYLKTHTKTGLKYLGKTTNKDPHKYYGSGKYWRRHLEKHGYNYTTEILHKSTNHEEIKEKGLYFSKLWNIVESIEFANLQEEKGDGVSSEFASQENNRRVANGTHHYKGPRSNLETKEKRNKTIKKNKSHNFLGGEIQRKRVEEGRHHLLGGEIQRKAMNKRVADGHHHLKQGNVHVVDLTGNTSFIPKEEYLTQTELVHINSFEGKRRMGKETRLTEKRQEYLKKKIICPHCGKEGNVSNMKRWHFDNCKQQI